MDDYIKREEVYDQLDRWARDLNYPKMYQRDDARCVIDGIPSADAAPVRHGWWDTSEDNRIVCSECTHGAPYMYKISDKLIMQELTYYCPYCGARMDGEK